jgi:hypothetical protein
MSSRAMNEEKPEQAMLTVLPVVGSTVVPDAAGDWFLTVLKYTSRLPSLVSCQTTPAVPDGSMATAGKAESQESPLSWVSAPQKPPEGWAEEDAEVEDAAWLAAKASSSDVSCESMLWFVLEVAIALAGRNI